MTNDATTYSNKIQDFIGKIKGSFVKRIDLDIDSDPTFNKKLLPFDFKYCRSLNIYTDKQDFTIQTTMADNGIETFWILPLNETIKSDNSLAINQTLKNIDIKNGFDNFPFKLKFEFEKSSLSILSGEIYDNSNGSFDLKINDEMLLVFLNDNDAVKFEQLTNK